MRAGYFWIRDNLQKTGLGGEESTIFSIHNSLWVANVANIYGNIELYQIWRIILTTQGGHNKGEILRQYISRLL